MTNTETAIKTSFGGREEHCAHRTHGVCGTKNGAGKKACMDEIRGRMTDNERLTIPDPDSVWIFPSAVAAVTSARACYNARFGR